MLVVLLFDLLLSLDGQLHLLPGKSFFLSLLYEDRSVSHNYSVSRDLLFFTPGLVRVVIRVVSGVPQKQSWICIRGGRKHWFPIRGDIWVGSVVPPDVFRSARVQRVRKLDSTLLYFQLHLFIMCRNLVQLVTSSIVLLFDSHGCPVCVKAVRHRRKTG